MTVGTNDTTEIGTDERTMMEPYLPAMLSPSGESGIVEDLLARLFRRRGGLRVRVRSQK